MVATHHGHHNGKPKVKKKISENVLHSRIFRATGGVFDALSSFLYAEEKVGYLVLLISYVMFKTDATKIGFCLAHLVIPFNLFVMVIFNEFYAEKVSAS